jgi:hypothetical protein
MLDAGSWKLEAESRLTFIDIYYTYAANLDETL